MTVGQAAPPAAPPAPAQFETPRLTRQQSVGSAVYQEPGLPETAGHRGSRQEHPEPVYGGRGSRQDSVHGEPPGYLSLPRQEAAPAPEQHTYMSLPRGGRAGPETPAASAAAAAGVPIGSGTAPAAASSAAASATSSASTARPPPDFLGAHRSARSDTATGTGTRWTPAAAAAAAALTAAQRLRAGGPQWTGRRPPEHQTQENRGKPSLFSFRGKESFTLDNS